QQEGDDSLHTLRMNSAGDTVTAAPGAGQQIQLRLLEASLSARHSLQLLMFSHTDPVLTAALLLKASQGVIVEAIYDLPRGTPSPDSQPDRLNKLLGHYPGMVYADGNRSVYLDPDGGERGGHLHHKTLIVDG